MIAQAIRLDLLNPVEIAYDVSGAVVRSPRGLDGTSDGGSFEFSGGGVLKATLRGCRIFTPERHAYLKWLAGWLRGSLRTVTVPVHNDPGGPFSVPFLSTLHTDGTGFTDGTGYVEGTVWGELAEAANLNAGTIRFALMGGGPALGGGESLGYFTATRGWRVTEVLEIDDVSAGPNPIYTVGLTRPLRAPLAAGVRLELVRPRCVMKLDPDARSIPVPVAVGYQSTVDIALVEAL